MNDDLSPFQGQINQPLLRWLRSRVKGSAMQRVDGYYLYQIGFQLHPLTELKTDITYGEMLLPIFMAEAALEPLLTRSIFKLKTSVRHGGALLEAIRYMKKKIDSITDYNSKAEFYDVYNLTTAARQFETVLGAELSLIDLYIVSKKGAYDTADLIANGWSLFPEELPTKVPECLLDIIQGTRCIAYELPTAAGFHLHRANESILHRYYDSVTGGAPRPVSRNIGDYLHELNKRKKGDPKVKSALKDLKDLHRNPLIHPEHSLETVADAIALLGSIHAVIVHMLKEIPVIAISPSAAVPAPVVVPGP